MAFDPLSALTGGLGSVADIGVGLYEQRRNEAFQQEMAKNGIRWRVEDANAAGVSPLFALGASGASGSSPSFITGDMGQNVSRAAMSGASPEERNRAVLQNKFLESQIAGEDLRSEGLRLQNAKLAQELYGQPGIPSLYGGTGGGRGAGLVIPEGQQFGAGLRGAVSPEAVKIPSLSFESRAVESGDFPAWQKFRMTDNTPVYLPYAGEGQTVFGNSPVSGMLIAGPQWLWQMGKRGLGYARESGRAARGKVDKWLRDFRYPEWYQ